MTHRDSREFDAMSPDAQTALDHGRAWDDIDPAFGPSACERVLAQVEVAVETDVDRGGPRLPGVGTSWPRSVLWLGLAGSVMVGLGAVIATKTARTEAEAQPVGAVSPSSPSVQQPKGFVPGTNANPNSDDAELRAASSLPSIDVSSLPVARPAVAPSAKSAATAPHDEPGQLEAELRLTSAAKDALALGAPRKALALLDEHERRFPNGELAEARESLRIQALLDAGDRAAAMDRADRFRRLYPGGVLLPSVERSLAPDKDR